MKVISIVGARPQFIKLAPLSKVLRENHQEVIIHTGQHFDKEMSDTFFSELDIPAPDYNLNINSGLHGEQSGRMLIDIEKVLVKEKPERVVVFGDTNSTLAGALAAAKMGIPVIHVEAGLRSFNKTMPEEINRIVADHTADCLLAPTQTAMDNLVLENLGEKSCLTGDIMVDAHQFAVEKAKNKPVIERMGLGNTSFYLLTLHRPYNVDNPLVLSGILNEIGKLPQRVVFPVHPRTKKIIEQNRITVPENIQLIKPLGYLDFVSLQDNASKILTDSGGIQKEAYILKKPCVTLRSETEWVETIRSGWNLLINPQEETAYAAKIEAFMPPQTYHSIFGDDVARKMLKNILDIG